MSSNLTIKRTRILNKLKTTMLLMTNRSNLKKRASMKFRISLWMRPIRLLKLKKSSKMISIFRMNSSLRMNLRLTTKNQLTRIKWRLFKRRNLTTRLQILTLSTIVFLSSKLRMKINQSAQ